MRLRQLLCSRDPSPTFEDLAVGAAPKWRPKFDTLQPALHPHPSSTINQSGDPTIDKPVKSFVMQPNAAAATLGELYTHLPP